MLTRRQWFIGFIAVLLAFMLPGFVKKLRSTPRSPKSIHVRFEQHKTVFRRTWNADIPNGKELT